MFWEAESMPGISHLPMHVYEGRRNAKYFMLSGRYSQEWFRVIIQCGGFLALPLDSLGLQSTFEAMWDLDFVLMFAKERSKRVKMTQREENYFSETGGKSRLCQACAGTHFKPHVLSFNHFSASMDVATESDFCSLSLIQTLRWLSDLWTRLQVCAFCVSATEESLWITFCSPYWKVWWAAGGPWKPPSLLKRNCRLHPSAVLSHIVKNQIILYLCMFLVWLKKRATIFKSL